MKVVSTNKTHVLEFTENELLHILAGLGKTSENQRQDAITNFYNRGPGEIDPAERYGETGYVLYEDLCDLLGVNL